MSNTIHMVLGRQGAGKSTYSKALAKKVNAVYFSIDEWMWQLYGDDMPKSMNLRWIMERVGRCEHRIRDLTNQVYDSGSCVVLDLGFTKLSNRDSFYSLASESNASIQVHYLKAPHSVRKQRVMERNNAKGETYSFEVTPSMFDFMEGEFHSPLDRELEKAIIIDTDNSDK